MRLALAGVALLSAFVSCNHALTQPLTQVHPALHRLANGSANLNNASSVLQLPALTINIPADYQFEDTIFRRVDRNIFVVADVATAQDHAITLVKLPELHALSLAPEFSLEQDGTSSPEFRTSCGANRTNPFAHDDVCLDDVEHALRFVLDADDLKRRVLVLLRKNDVVKEVAHRAALFLGSFMTGSAVELLCLTHHTPPGSSRCKFFFLFLHFFYYV